jgi:hypothetical protein
MDTQVILIKLEVAGQQIRQIIGQRGPEESTGKQFRWRGTDADFVELIYGLKLLGVIEIDGRAAELKEISGFVGGWFGKVPRDIYYTGMMNLKRKKDKTPFLNKMIKAVLRETCEGEGEA